MEYSKLRSGKLMPAIGYGTVNVGRLDGKYENPLTGDFPPYTPRCRPATGCSTRRSPMATRRA